MAFARGKGERAPRILSREKSRKTNKGRSSARRQKNGTKGRGETKTKNLQKKTKQKQLSKKKEKKRKDSSLLLTIAKREVFSVGKKPVRLYVYTGLKSITGARRDDRKTVMNETKTRSGHDYI